MGIGCWPGPRVIPWLQCVADVLFLQAWGLGLLSQQPQLALGASLKPFLGLCSKTLQGALRDRSSRKTFTSGVAWIALGWSHPRDAVLGSSLAQRLRSSAALAVQTQVFPCLAFPACLTQPWPCCLSRLLKVLSGCDTSSGASLAKVLGIEGEVCQSLSSAGLPQIPEPGDITRT